MDDFNVVGFIMAFESGEATDEQIISGFQTLIDNGMVWNLQGVYGRTARALIDQGFCFPADQGERIRKNDLL